MTTENLLVRLCKYRAPTAWLTSENTCSGFVFAIDWNTAVGYFHLFQYWLHSWIVSPVGHGKATMNFRFLFVLGLKKGSKLLQGVDVFGVLVTVGQGSLE